MTTQLFPDSTPGERFQMLQDNCVNMEDAKLKRFYSDEEMGSLREKVTNQAIKLSDLEDQIKILVTPLKEEIKVIKLDQKVNLTQVRMGHEEIAVTLYAFEDQEEGMMGFYDQDGKLVNMRKLYPHERQTRIVDMHQVKGGGL